MQTLKPHEKLFTHHSVNTTKSAYFPPIRSTNKYLLD
jgi:hypothetical protein